MKYIIFYEDPAETDTDTLIRVEQTFERSLPVIPNKLVLAESKKSARDILKEIQLLEPRGTCLVLEMGDAWATSKLSVKSFMVNP